MTHSTLDDLRETIRQSAWSVPRCRRLSVGVSAIDDTMGGGLTRPGLHQLRGPGALEFALILAQRMLAHNHSTQLFFCAVHGSRIQIYPPALMASGVDMERVYSVKSDDDAGVLWAAHACLESESEALVLLFLARPLSILNARKLQLAAQPGQALALVLSADPMAGHGVMVPLAHSCWHVWWCLPDSDIPATIAGGSARMGIELRKMHLTLLKHRFGGVGSWQVMHDVETNRLSLCSQPSDRSGEDEPLGEEFSRGLCVTEC